MTSDSYFINHPYLHELHKLNLSVEEMESLYYSGFNMTMMGDYYYPYDEADELYTVPLSIIVLLSLLYGGVSVAALIGNVLVLWVVAVSQQMRTVTNMFIANLALADIIIGLFAIPFQFQAALLQRWNLPEFLCSFCPFVQVLSVNVSVFTLSAIAVDRYRAVMYPFKARASKKKATCAILSIWFIGVFLAFPTELDYKVLYIPQRTGVDSDSGSMPFCTNLGLHSAFRMYYNLSLVVIQYFFPLLIISGAYFLMARKLWGTSAPGNREDSRDAVVLRNKKKVIKMLALVVLLFAVCWLPLQTYYMLQALFRSINEYPYINIIWFSSHWLAMSNSCYNPFIYALYNNKFQREFRARLRFLPLLGKWWDDSVWSEVADAGTNQEEAKMTFRATNHCYFPHLHRNSSRLNSVNSGRTVKQYKCNNNQHHYQNRSIQQHSSSKFYPRRNRYREDIGDPQVQDQSQLPLAPRKMSSVTKNLVVRATSSPINIAIAETSFNLVQNVVVGSTSYQSYSTDNSWT
ncbi:unnamed protein product [Orchesella dallaii]|uniref:G-protein coupled receptors family 1 profile domain-containing protein n=1 Tax=Orchesella dallaii TaxID=48710 RepID=A0ABP1Q1N7_9HEXA